MKKTTQPHETKERKPELLNQICYWLIKMCVDTNATEAKVTQENVTVEERNIGDWEILVRKKGK